MADLHNTETAPTRVNLDRLLETCLVATHEFKRFLDDIEQPPSEDFLLDRAAFEKQAARLNAFDIGFGKLMDGREAKEDWRCLQGMRTALSGVLLLLAENCYNTEAPAMEEICEELEEWLEGDGAEAFEQVKEMVEDLNNSPATAYIEECNTPFIEPAYTPSDIGSESSINSDADYMTPLQSQSRVSSFGSIFSDDGKPDYLVDFTAVIERFRTYNGVLVDSLELVEDIMKWNYETNLERFEVMRAGAANRPLGCIQVQCEEAFAHGEEWRQHVEHCSVRGISFPVPQVKTKFETATVKCPIASCSAPFATWEKLRQHQDLAHKIFICSLSSCGVAFFSWENATEHVRCVHRGTASLQESWMTKDVTQFRNNTLTFFPDHSRLFDLRITPPEFLRRSGTLPTPTSPTAGPNFDFDFDQPDLLRQPTFPTLGRSRSHSDVKLKAPRPTNGERPGTGVLPMQRSRSTPGLNTHQKSESFESIIMMLKSPWTLQAPGTKGFTIRFD